MDENVRLMNRFVRPIYDAIDNRQYKTAIKLSLHKKVQHLDIVQVLRAHCLERTGKEAEALTICRAVQRNHPTDETLLNTMYLVFRLGGCEHEMLPSFEYACANTQPPNEELFHSLFFCYAREGHFLKQQQTALKMYKAFSNAKYMCWASVSMMLQVRHRHAPAKMLSLAEKMLAKVLQSTGSPSGEALQLLIAILQEQSLSEAALMAFDQFPPPENASASAKPRAVEGDGAYEEDIELGPMQTIDRLSLEASLAKEAALWKRCKATYETLLLEYNADDWLFLTEYITASFEATAASDLGSDSDSECATRIVSFLTELQDRNDNRLLRGPLLAIVHVHRVTLERLDRRNDASAVVTTHEEALVDAIIAYMERFYTKTCCFTDLTQYLKLFGGSTATYPMGQAASTRLVAFLTRMASDNVWQTAPKDSKAQEQERKLALNRLNRRLLALKSLRFLGADVVTRLEHLEALVQSLEDEYDATNWLNVGATGGQREVQHTDDLLLLAAQILVEVHHKSSRPKRASFISRHLVHAAALLEYGLQHSAYNFQMKLLLCRLYACLGAGDGLLARYAELDIKQIQLDSLSYLILDKLVVLGHFPECRVLCEKIVKLHRATQGETPEYLTRAYRLGVYSKVLDMTRFLYEKMKKSHTLAIATAELLQFQLMDAVMGQAHAVVTSESFKDDVAALETMLTRAEEQDEGQTRLSANQHREIGVLWTQEDAFRTADVWPEAENEVVEYDRSKDTRRSLNWLSLRLQCCQFVQSVASEETEKARDYSKQCQETLVSLGVRMDGKTLYEAIWRLSVLAMDAMTAFLTARATADDDMQWKTACEALRTLGSLLETVSMRFVTALTSPWLSVSSVAMLSALMGESGVYMTIILSELSRFCGSARRKKTTEAMQGFTTELGQCLTMALRLFVSIETQLTSRTLPSEDTPTSLYANACDGLREGERLVLKNVATSQETIIARLLLLVRDRIAIFQQLKP